MWPFSLLKRSLENPQVSLSDPNNFLGLFTRSAAGEVVNVETSMAISALWACWRILAETMASLSIEVIERKGDTIEVLNDHPYRKLLAQSPSHRYTSFTWREAMMLNGMAYGVMYSEIVRHQGTGDAVELRVHNSSKVTPIEDNQGKIYYQVQETVNGKTNTRTLLSMNMIAIPLMSFDGFNTNGILMKARNLLGEALAAQSLTSDYMANGAMLDGILSSDADLTKDQRKQLADAWSKKQTGSGNRGKTAILSNGLKYQPISGDMNDSNILELRKFYNEEAARYYNVPLSMINILDRATNNNIEQLSLDFGKFTIRPYVKRWEQELKRKLFIANDNQYARFNMDSILRGDVESRGNYYEKALLYGWLTRNEVRGLENRNPVEGGDDPTPLFILQTQKGDEGNEDV